MAARCLWTGGSCSGRSASQRRSPATPEIHTQVIFSSHRSSSDHLPILTSNSSSRFAGDRRNSNQYTPLRRRRGRLFAQLPPQSDPPPDKEPLTLEGLVEGISRFRERVQIFFAVFVWMSLFFWYSVWDDRNKGGGGGSGGIGMSNRRSRSPFRR